MVTLLHALLIGEELTRNKGKRSRRGMQTRIHPDILGAKSGRCLIHDDLPRDRVIPHVHRRFRVFFESPRGERRGRKIPDDSKVPGCCPYPNVPLFETVKRKAREEGGSRSSGDRQLARGVRKLFQMVQTSKGCTMMEIPGGG